jgi:NTE family protein/lysophospholipid hydrolase
MKRVYPPSDKIALSFLLSSKLLSKLDTHVLSYLASELKWFRLDDGEVFIRKDLPARSMYLVYKGLLEAFTMGEDGEPIPLAELGPGESVGELAVLAGDRRSASVRATGATVVARFSQSGLIRTAAKKPEILSQFTDAVRHHQREVRLRAILRESDLFAGWSVTARDNLETELEWMSLADDEVFIREGEAGDFLAILVSGRLQILAELPNGEIKLISELGPGDTVGEMALFTGAPRTATVKAIRDSEIVKLYKSNFDRLVGQHPHEMVNAFAGKIISRLWNNLQGITPRRSSLSTLVIVPMSPDVPLSDFGRRLARAFAPMGKTTHLNSRLVDEILEIDGISQTKPQDFNNGRLVAWLNEQEHRSDFVIFEADPSPTPWSLRCLRQSDLALLIGLAKHDPAQIAVDFKHLAANSTSSDTRQALVLLHDDKAEHPSGTQEWLDRWPVHSYHHVRENRMADYQRLARIVTGRATGLVLSGGGARGSAHIGVLRALIECGIEIDHIGGNSMGSIVAAGHALGLDPEGIGRLIKEMYRLRNTFDPTIPLVSMLSRRRLANYFRKVFGERQIEDLWLPFFCVSSNLTRAEVVTHDRGPLYRWVIASNSAPGLMPPVVHQGDLLLDGSLLDDMPIDIMRDKIGNGTVIAVDVSPLVDLAENPDYGDYLSGFRVLWSRINPFTPAMKLPNIAAILQRSGELSSKRTQRNLVNARLADLYLRPPVEHFSLTDTSAVDEIAAIGYESAKEQIEHWQSAFYNV